MTLLVQGQRYTEILRQFLSGRKHSFSVSPFNFPLSPSLYALSTPVIYSHGPLAPMREICQMTVLYSFGLFQSGGGGGKWGGQKVECIFILSLTWLPHSRFLQPKKSRSFSSHFAYGTQFQPCCDQKPNFEVPANTIHRVHISLFKWNSKHGRPQVFLGQHVFFVMFFLFANFTVTTLFYCFSCMNFSHFNYFMFWLKLWIYMSNLFSYVRKWGILSLISLTFEKSLK